MSSDDLIFDAKPGVPRMALIGHDDPDNEPYLCMRVGWWEGVPEFTPKQRDQRCGLVSKFTYTLHEAERLLALLPRALAYAKEEIEGVKEEP